MRQFLKTLSIGVLFSIAKDLGFAGRCNAAESIDFIVEQSKSYRWSVGDLCSRYNIKAET